jgi:hypothetical protein
VPKRAGPRGSRLASDTGNAPANVSRELTLKERLVFQSLILKEEIFERESIAQTRPLKSRIA